MTITISDGLQRIGAARIRELIQRSRGRKRQGLPPFDTEDFSVPTRLYSKYRRPLLQILLKRHVAPEDAQELMLHAFDQAGAAVRNKQVESRSTLEEYLYRLTCNLATAYWRGETIAEPPRPLPGG